MLSLVCAIRIVDELLLPSEGQQMKKDYGMEERENEPIICRLVARSSPLANKPQL